MYDAFRVQTLPDPVEDSMKMTQSAHTNLTSFLIGETLFLILSP